MFYEFDSCGCYLSLYTLKNYEINYFLKKENLNSEERKVT